MWLGILNGEVKENSCAFSSTDNESAFGWTHESIFSDSAQEPHVSISLKLSNLAVDHCVCMCIRHFAGWMNVVAHFLSRDFHFDDTFLTHLLTIFYPNKLPPCF